MSIDRIAMAFAGTMIPASLARARQPGVASA